MREQIAPGIYVEGDSILVDPDLAHPDDIEEVRGIEEEEVGRRRGNRDRGNDRKGLRDRISDARQKSLNRRLDRSEDREDRREDRRDDREDRRDDREDGRNGNGGSMSKQTVVEIVSATNSGAAAADVEATVLIQYNWFKVKRIVDNGSGAGTRIKQIWSGKQLLVDYGTNGIVSTMFATNSNYITNQALENLVFQGGRNLKVVMNVGAGLTGSLLFEGEAPVVATLCG